MNEYDPWPVLVAFAVFVFAAFAIALLSIGGGR